MSPLLRWPLYLLLLLVGALIAGVSLLGILVVLAYPRLPSLEVLADYQPKIPLRVYTADGHLIGEFGEERRSFIHINDVPEVMKQAILAAEDERFYSHGGVDTLGVLRAAYSNFIGGGRRQGASTITMQVARNFFLSREKTLTRKLYEALLSFKIEHSFSKDEILQLYINQIYLGQRAYGFSSAAQIYYGKRLEEITLAEAAMLAGLPKAPSSYNPVVNPQRAKLRQLYVLRRMLTLHYISEQAYNEAQNETLTIKRDHSSYALHAEFVAEMARQIAHEQFQDDIYTRGIKIITTITKADQEAAYASLRNGLFDYDRRRGYRGIEAHVEIPATAAEQHEALEDLLAGREDFDDLRLALVLEANPNLVRAYLRGGEIIQLTGNELKFASRMLSDSAPASKRIRRGAIIRVNQNTQKKWQISQAPLAEGAFVAASPVDGAVRALVGGFDFNRNKFNHVTQAWRQPGSSFKPFIYSAALEKGYSPATVLSDEPIYISAEETGSRAWEPKNYDGKYDGPMTLRTGLAKSKNMISIHLLKSIGPQYAQDYITRFGFDARKHPPYLTMALGSGAVTPWQQLAAYSIFANGGYRVTPFIVRQILDDKGHVLAETKPAIAGDEALRVLDPRNAYLMDSMLHEVVKRGTASKARVILKRSDLAGKTGTTNDYVDAWFCGYQPTVVGISWIGFDQPKNLGRGETGGATALPIWINYMSKVLQDVPETTMSLPDGLVPVEPVGPDGEPGAPDYIYAEDLPALNSADEQEGEGAADALSSFFSSLFSSPPVPAPLPDIQQTPAPVQDARPRPVQPPAQPKNPAPVTP